LGMVVKFTLQAFKLLSLMVIYRYMKQFYKQEARIRWKMGFEIDHGPKFAAYVEVTTDVFM
jgi:hypothetical protein